MRLALSDSESDSGSESGRSRSSTSRRSRSKSRSVGLEEDGSDVETEDEDMPPVDRLQDSDSEETSDSSNQDYDATHENQSVQEPSSRTHKGRQASIVPSSPSVSPSPEPAYPDVQTGPLRQSLAQLSGQDQFRNKVMQASLFQSRQPPHSHTAASTSSHGPLSRSGQNQQQQSRQLTLPAPSSALLEEDETAFQELALPMHVAPRVPGRAPRAPKKLERVSETQTTLNANAPDPGLRLTRSFASAWGPDGSLVRPSSNPLSQPTALQFGPTTQATTPTANALDKLLSVKLAHTTFCLDEQGIPQASSLPSLRFSHFEAAAIHQDVFSLGKTLFDPLGLTDLPQDPSQADVVGAHARRSALLSWWTSHTASLVEKSFRQAVTALEGTLALLTGCQIERAADSAMDQHDFRLATLIAQAGTADADFKTDLHNQLQKWEHLDMTQQVDKSYRAILALLAGRPLPPSSSVDWQRRLACTLFYSSPELSQALQNYTPTAEEEEDYSFELIRLFCRLSPALEHTLLPAHFPGAAAVERECQSWIAYQLLTKVHRFADFEQPESSSCQLVVSLAAGLEQSGLWSWAAFVLLHLDNSQSREKTIKDVLCRHAAQFDDATLSALESYGIPSTWISEAQARLALAEEDRFAGALAFADADMLVEAHDITVWDLAPEAVLVGDMELLDRLLEPFVGRELHVNWLEGGHFFQTYASAVRLQTDLQHGKTDQIGQLRQALPKMLMALPTFLLKPGEARRPLVREAAVSQMLSVCTRLWGLLDPSQTGDAGVSAKEMADPVDYVATLAGHGFEQALAEALA